MQKIECTHQRREWVRIRDRNFSGFRQFYWIRLNSVRIIICLIFFPQYNFHSENNVRLQELQPSRFYHWAQWHWQYWLAVCSHESTPHTTWGNPKCNQGNLVHQRASGKQLEICAMAINRHFWLFIWGWNLNRINSWNLRNEHLKFECTLLRLQ